MDSIGSPDCEPWDGYLASFNRAIASLEQGVSSLLPVTHITL
jgi:hypothetical protein